MFLLYIPTNLNLIFFTSFICFLLLSFFTSILETELKSTLLVVLLLIMAISIIKLHLEFNFKTKDIKKIKYLNNVLESTEQNNTF